MIYGWGTDTRAKQLDNATVAVCRFKYVSLAVFFSLVWNRRWFLQGRDRALDREVSPAEIESMFGPGSVPSPGIWKRLGLVLSVGAFVVLAAASAAGRALFDGDGGGGDGDVPIAAIGEADESASPSTTAVGVGGDEGRSESTVAGSEGAEGGALSVADSGAVASDAADEVLPSGGEVGMVELVSADQRISTDLGDVGDVDAGELWIDGIYATSRVDHEYSQGGYQARRRAAEDGNKIVVVDIQLLAESSNGNFFDEVLRIIDENGRIYTPLDRINFPTFTGTIFNAEVLFEVPVDLTSFRFQGGAHDDDRDGYQADWDVQLVPGDVGPYLPDPSDPIEGPVEATLISDDNIGLMGLRNTRMPTGSLDILDANVVAKIDGVAANLGFKWVVVEAQMIAETSGNFSEETFRVRTGGEIYPAIEQINLSPNEGEVWSGPLVFEVPVGAVDAVLEMGTPSNWPDGKRAEYQLTLP